MNELTPELLQGVPQNGPTDPIKYYRRPLVGQLFCERINLGLRLLPAKTYPCALEIGYGSGGLLLLLSQMAAELHGIDLDANPEPVNQVLKDRGCQATLRQGSVYDLPYGVNSFDLIVCFSVFEHLHDFPRALQEVHRVLKPGGLFLLGMPTVSRMMGVFFHAIGHGTIDDIHVTTPAMVTGAFTNAGFQLVSSRNLDIPFNQPFGLRLYHNWLLTKAAG